MSKRTVQKQARLEKKKKKQIKQLIIGSVVTVAVIIVVVFLVNFSPTALSSQNISLDENGDLRIPVAGLQKNLNYIDFGGNEELIVWKNNDGEIRTAFDTCAECYPGGNVHFTLDGTTLTCSFCGTTQAVSMLGSAEWGSCRPLSIIPDYRSDTDTEVVVPADVLSYSAQMFNAWDADDFSISLADYRSEV